MIRIDNLLFDLRSSPVALGARSRTTIFVAFSLKPNMMKASFLPSLKLLKASMHSESAFTPDAYFELNHD